MCNKCLVLWIIIIGALIYAARVKRNRTEALAVAGVALLIGVYLHAKNG